MLRAIGSGLGLNWGSAPQESELQVQVYDAATIEPSFDKTYDVTEAEEYDAIFVDKRALQAQTVPQEIVEQLKKIEANIAKGKTIGNRIAGLIVLNFLSQKFSGKEEAVLKLVSTAEKKLSEENILKIKELTSTPYSDAVANKIRTIFGILQADTEEENA